MRCRAGWVGVDHGVEIAEFIQARLSAIVLPVTTCEAEAYDIHLEQDR